MFKKIMQVLIILILSLTIVACGGSKYTPLEEFDYEVNDNKITLIQYYGSRDVINIAPKYDKKVVVKLEDKLFKYKNNIKEIILPDTIEEIGNNCFSNLGNLEKINFPKSLKKIGSDIFSIKNTKLITKENDLFYIGTPNNPYKYFLNTLNYLNKEIIINDRCEYINTYIIRYYKNLEKIVLPKKLKLYAEVFLDDEYFKTHMFNVYENGNYVGTKDNPYMILLDMIDKTKDNFKLHKDCKRIKSFAFKESNIKNIDLTRNIVSIGYQAFINSHNLEMVDLSNVEHIENYAFKDCTNLKKVVLNDSLTKIPYAAFDRCKNLKTINLPKSLETIDTLAFSETGIEDITFPENLKEINDGAFNMSPLKKTILPDSLIHIGESALNESFYEEEDEINYIGTKTNPYKFLIRTKFLHSDYYNINNMCEVITKHAFGNTTMKELDLPSNLKVIEDEAFVNSARIESINLPETLEKIGSKAFYHCDKLKEINIPSSIKSLPKDLFIECDRLEKITIPGSIKRLQHNTLVNCRCLKEINLEEGIEILDWEFFTNLPNLEKINFPNSLRIIKGMNFYYNKVKNVELGPNLIYIDKSIVGNLDYFKIDKDNKYYSSGDNNDCLIDKENKKLLTTTKKFTSIPEDVKIIGQNSINMPNGNNNLIIPNGVEEIEMGAFNNVFQEKFIIPASVKKLAHHIFSNTVKYVSVDKDNKVYDSREDCNAVFETKTDKLIIATLNTTIPNSIKDMDYTLAYELMKANNKIEYDNGYYIGSIDNPYIIYIKNKEFKETLNIHNDTKIVLLNYLEYTENDKKYNIILPNEDCKVCGDSSFLLKLNLNKFDNGYYLGTKSNPYLILVKTEENIDNIKIHEDCKIINYINYSDKIKEIVIPSNVEKINDYAFSSLFNLENIYIPKSVKEIGENILMGNDKVVVNFEIDKLNEEWINLFDETYGKVTVKFNIKK